MTIATFATGRYFGGMAALLNRAELNWVMHLKAANALGLMVPVRDESAAGAIEPRFSLL
jgi:hypothetical protein